MSVILRLNSKEFLKKFIKKENVEDYTIILLSDSITTKNRYENVLSIKNLVPDSKVLSYHSDKHISEKFSIKYSNMLKTKENTEILASIVNEAISNNKKIVLLCSEIEEQFNYLKLLGFFIYEVFGVKTYSYSKYKKLETLPKYNSTELVDRIKKIIKSDEIKTLAQLVQLSNLNKEKMKEKMKEMGKKKLFKHCKQQGFNVNEDDSRKDLILLYCEFFNKYLIV